jgi:methyl-accepting chemotaxis protein
MRNKLPALTGIGRQVNEITEMNTQIAAAVEQQSAVSEDINRGITNIATPPI